jgi:hypothetical protein
LGPKRCQATSLQRGLQQPTITQIEVTILYIKQELGLYRYKGKAKMLILQMRATQEDTSLDVDRNPGIVALKLGDCDNENAIGKFCGYITTIYSLRQRNGAGKGGSARKLALGEYGSGV